VWHVKEPSLLKAVSAKHSEIAEKLLVRLKTNTQNEASTEAHTVESPGDLKSTSIGLDPGVKFKIHTTAISELHELPFFSKANKIRTERIPVYS
jgi:hypothetical protein